MMLGTPSSDSTLLIYVSSVPASDVSDRFRELKDTGLILTERRAIHCHLSEISMKWQELSKKDENAEQKWTWFMVSR